MPTEPDLVTSRAARHHRIGATRTATWTTIGDAGHQIHHSGGSPSVVRQHRARCTATIEEARRAKSLSTRACSSHRSCSPAVPLSPFRSDPLRVAPPCQFTAAGRPDAVDCHERAPIGRRLTPPARGCAQPTDIGCVPTRGSRLPARHNCHPVTGHFVRFCAVQLAVKRLSKPRTSQCAVRRRTPRTASRRASGRSEPVFRLVPAAGFERTCRRVAC